MNKYPVIYKGKEYEVRWEEDWRIYLVIYEVKEIKIFNKIKIKRRIQKYCKSRDEVQENIITIFDDDPNYYIEEVKTLFKLWEDNLTETEHTHNSIEKQVQALEEWDGVIDE